MLLLLLPVPATVGELFQYLNADFCLSMHGEKIKGEFLSFFTLLSSEEEAFLTPGSQFTPEEITISYRSY